MSNCLGEDMANRIVENLGLMPKNSTQEDAKKAYKKCMMEMLKGGKWGLYFSHVRRRKNSKITRYVLWWSER